MRQSQFDIIFKIINSHINGYYNNCSSKYFDSEFDPYNLNHQNIRLAYSSIKKNKKEFEKNGYSYSSRHYGSCNMNVCPCLYNKNEEILFFSVNNELNSKFLSDEYNKVFSKKELFVIQFSIKGNLLKILIAKRKTATGWDVVFNKEV